MNCNICFEEFNNTNVILDFKCSIKNCNCFICNECITNIYDNFKDDSEIFKCPLCRQICYREYFRTNVLNIELKEKILTKKNELMYKIEFNKQLIEKLQQEIQENILHLNIYN